MKRQPRLDLKKHVGNYNYEQFREYTALYDEAKLRDDAEIKHFYQMVKYAKLNVGKGDKHAVEFAKKYRLELIEVPEEFKDVSIDDLELRSTRRSKRPILR